MISSPVPHPGAPMNLRCEDQTNPLGVDVTRPRLAWTLDDPRRGARQTAYRIQTAATREALEIADGRIWDSGRVESDRSIQVAYDGPPLASRQRLYWRVRTWDVEGVASPWSPSAWWEMGLLEASDWTGAEWIAAPSSMPPEPIAPGRWIRHPENAHPGENWWWQPIVQFRREIEIEATPASARIQLAAEVCFVLYVDGEWIGAGDGPKRIDYDLSDTLGPGRHTIVVDVRRTADHAPSLIAALEWTDAVGGAVHGLGTDALWQCAEKAPEELATVALNAERFTHAREIAPDEAPQVDAWPLIADPLQPAPCFRKTFTLDAPVRRARVYVCGLGYHELRINGRKVGDHVLDPAQSDYPHRAFYVTHDVTDRFVEGENVVGATLGGGFFDQPLVWGGMSYGPRCLIARIEIEHADGSTRLVATDAAWRVTTDGPLRADNPYYGEAWDARREFDDAEDGGGVDWTPVRTIASPTERLVAQTIPPIRAVEQLRPVARTQPRPGVWLFDMGRNFSGWVRLRVADAPAGTRLHLRMSEKLDRDGRIDPWTTGYYHTHVVQSQTYICRGGDEEETWEPRFCWHGFRWVELTGWPDGSEPSLGALTGVVVHSDLPQRGAFNCSDPLIDRIHDMALRTLRGNLHSIPTDCPHREKCGWLGDAHVAGEMMIFNHDSAQFLAKYVHDILTSLVDGLPTMIAPGQRSCGEAKLDWGTAIVQVPWYLYLYYGDARILEEVYPHWARWFEHLAELADGRHTFGDEIPKYGLGDWCPPGQRMDRLWEKDVRAPVDISSSAYYYLDAWIAARVARVLGRSDDAARFERLAADIRCEFIERFYDAERETFGWPTADALALEFGLVPEGRAGVVAESLARRIHDDGTHAWVGIMGQRYLYGALARGGRGDTAHALITQRTWPSMGFLLDIGATTLWEVFGQSDERDPHPIYSLNHPMQGGFDMWFYEGVAGIAPDPDRPGFRHVRMRPDLTHQLDHAEAWHDGPYGRIVSAWRRDEAGFHWRVRVPANTTATVWVPAGPSDAVWEGDAPVVRSEGVHPRGYEDGFAVFDLGAGAYRFRVGKEAPEKDGHGRTPMGRMRPNE